MLVLSVVIFQVVVCATSRSLIQRSPTEYGASLCVTWKPQKWGGHGQRWAATPGGGGKCNKGRTSVYVVIFFQFKNAPYQWEMSALTTSAHCFVCLTASHYYIGIYLQCYIHIKPSSGDLYASWTIYRNARWSPLGLQIIERKPVYGHTASFPNFPLKYIWWSGKTLSSLTYEYTNTENEQVPETLANCSFVLRKPDITVWVTTFPHSLEDSFFIKGRKNGGTRKML